MNFYPKTLKYTWSLCCVFTGMASSLTMAAICAHLFQESPLIPLFGIGLCSVFSVECARQACAYRKTWPEKSIFWLCPFSLINLFDTPTVSVGIVIGIGLTAFNLLLWFIAYKLAKRLVAISPY